MDSRLRRVSRAFRAPSTRSGIACPQGAPFLRRCDGSTFRKQMAAHVRWAFRCGLHNAPCSIRVGGSYGNAGRVGNPIPQSAICRVGDRDDVWQAGLPLLCCYEAAVDPVIDDPHTDAVSLANLVDVERTGGKRRAGNAILVSDPSDHADRESLAGRACEAVAV